MTPTTYTAEHFNAATRNRLGGARAGFILDLAIANVGGCCPMCGDAFDGDAVAAHYVPATFHGAPSRDRAGWVEGNIFAACRECNAWQGERFIEDARLVAAANFRWVGGRRESAQTRTKSDKAAQRRANGYK